MGTIGLPGLGGMMLTTLLMSAPAAWADEEEDLLREELEEELVEPGETDWNGRTSLELGVTIGMPGLLQGMVGFWPGRVGLNLTGMYWGPYVYGFQLAPAYRFVSPARGEHRVALLAGKMVFDDADIITGYAGPAYQFHGKYGFFFEGGLVLAPGYTNIPQIWFQLGWAGRIELPMAPLL